MDLGVLQEGASACTTWGRGHLVVYLQQRYLFYALAPGLQNGENTDCTLLKML